jgi:hypothetical protein
VDEAGWYLEVMRFFEREAASIEAGRIVPACLGWDVHDLVAHQVHQLSSASDGSFPVQDSLDAMVAVEVGERQAARARQDQWTAEGVRARRETPVEVLIAELRRLAAQAPAAPLSALFPDMAVHLFDLLGAGGSSAYRDHALVVPALRFWNSFAEVRLQQVGRGPIRLELLVPSRSQDAAIGPTDAPLVAAGTAFELLRAIVGRRSRRQAGELRWDGADEVAIEVFAVYGWRSDDLDE